MGQCVLTVSWVYHLCVFWVETLFPGFITYMYFGWQLTGMQVFGKAPKFSTILLAALPAPFSQKQT